MENGSDYVTGGLFSAQIPSAVYGRDNFNPFSSAKLIEGSIAFLAANDHNNQTETKAPPPQIAMVNLALPNARKDGGGEISTHIEKKQGLEPLYFTHMPTTFAIQGSTIYAGLADGSIEALNYVTGQQIQVGSRYPTALFANARL